jgi:hypothetical protein
MNNETADERPDLQRLLDEATVRLGELFPGAPLRRSLQRDEAGVLPAEVILSVVTDIPLADAFDLLDRFDEDWWLEASARGDGQMTVTVERP